jgi:hypothetical protein
LGKILTKNFLKLITRHGALPIILSVTIGLLSTGLISSGLAQIILFENAQKYEAASILFLIFTGSILAFISGFIKIKGTKKIATTIFSEAESILFSSRKQSMTTEIIDNEHNGDEDEEGSGKIVLVTRCIFVLFQFAETISLYVFLVGYCLFFEIFGIFLIIHILALPLLIAIKFLSQKIKIVEKKFRSCNAKFSLNLSINKVTFFEQRFLYFLWITVLALIWIGFAFFIIISFDLMSGSPAEIIVLIFIIKILRILPSAWGMWQRYYPILSSDRNFNAAINFLSLR